MFKTELLIAVFFFVGNSIQKIDPVFPGANECKDDAIFPKEYGEEFDLFHETSFGPKQTMIEFSTAIDAVISAGKLMNHFKVHEIDTKTFYKFTKEDGYVIQESFINEKELVQEPLLLPPGVPVMPEPYTAQVYNRISLQIISLQEDHYTQEIIIDSNENEEVLAMSIADIPDQEATYVHIAVRPKEVENFQLNILILKVERESLWEKVPINTYLYQNVVVNFDEPQDMWNTAITSAVHSNGVHFFSFETKSIAQVIDVSSEKTSMILNKSVKQEDTTIKFTKLACDSYYVGGGLGGHKGGYIGQYQYDEKTSEWEMKQFYRHINENPSPAYKPECKEI